MGYLVSAPFPSARGDRSGRAALHRIKSAQQARTTEITSDLHRTPSIRFLITLSSLQHEQDGPPSETSLSSAPDSRPLSTLENRRWFIGSQSLRVNAESMDSASGARGRHSQVSRIAPVSCRRQRFAGSHRQLALAMRWPPVCRHMCARTGVRVIHGVRFGAWRLLQAYLSLPKT